MRLDKLIANNTNYSRSQVHKLIKNKLIMVNQQIVSSVDYKIIVSDIISIDGQDLFFSQEKEYLMLNKSIGYVCSHTDDFNPTIYEIFANRFKNFNSVGRLDVNTSGLLLVTNDGEFLHRMTSPRYHVEKRYFVTLERPIEDNYLNKLTDGILLRGETKVTLPAKLEIIDEYNVNIIIREGRYHQVRRMFAALGNKVVALHRYQIGSLKLDTDLTINQYRNLNEQEIKNLKQLINII